MTSKQFIKKYIPKPYRLEAEECLDEIIQEAEEETYAGGAKDVISHLRGALNEAAVYLR